MSEPEVREEWVEAVAEAVGVHRWKDMGVDWCSCECGQVLCADPSDPLLTAFPADDVFREHIARAALAALVPLIEADVGERIATALYRRVDEWERCIPVFGPVDGTGRPDPKGQMMVDVSREGLMADLRIEIARAVATGDEGGSDE